MNELTGEDKVVLLLGTLPPQTVELVLSKMPPPDADLLRVRLAAPRPLPAPENLRQAVNEFNDLHRISTRAFPAIVQPPPPTDAIKSAEPPPPAEAPEPSDDPVAILRESAPEVLAIALRGEQLSTVALVLGCLDVARAGPLLKLLPAEVRHEAVTRQVRPVSPHPALVQRILAGVVARCRQVVESGADRQDDPEERLGELVRALDRPDRLEVLKRLDGANPALAQKIRDDLYRFTDILRLDDRTLSRLLGEIDARTMALCLKTADEDLKTKAMNNLTRRAREAVGEEMELLGNVPPNAVQEAQGTVVKAIRQLDEEGALTLN